MGVFASRKLDEEIALSLLDRMPDEPASDDEDGQAGPNLRTPPMTAERRRSFRRPLGVVATMSRLINGEAVHPLVVLVLNRSDHGFGMRSPASFVRHELYQLTIGSGDAAQTHFIRVVSSRMRDDGLYDIGAQAG